MFLRIETLWKEKNGTYTEISPLKFRSLSTAVCKKIDMRTPEDMKKKEFKIIGDDLKKILEDTIENSEHTFLFCGRKGLYPQTICSDCGTIVLCKNCSAPVVLHKKKTPNNDTGNVFLCHHCGKREDASTLCIHCGGWRLGTLGIGTEKVFEDIKKLFPNSNISIMDTEHIKTHLQAIKARDLFYNTPGSIMIGTEMALPYLNQKIENTAIISVDSYFSIPDFKINEKIFHILLELRSLSNKNMLIQTRNTNTTIFDYALSGNLIDFYRDEIIERKSVGFPPFVTHIKLTLEGNRATIKKEMAEIEESLKPYTLSVFDSFNLGKNNSSIIHGLISLPQGKWVDKMLLDKLRLLPLNITIKIDPDTLL
jgi:primosomal protein N' (replication factor Y)